MPSRGRIEIRNVFGENLKEKLPRMNSSGREVRPNMNVDLNRLGEMVWIEFG